MPMARCSRSTRSRPGSPSARRRHRVGGVTPNLVCLAKSLGGGDSVAAIGGTRQRHRACRRGGYEIVGTFDGDPRAIAAAARAMLTEVATEEAYQRIERPAAARRRRDRRGDRGLRAERRRVVTASAKGCVVFAGGRSATTEASSPIDDSLSHAHWLFQHNGGVFLPPWGKVEQWLISVQHDESDIDRLVAQLPVLRRPRSRRVAAVRIAAPRDAALACRPSTTKSN